MSFFMCASAFAQYVWLDEKGVKQFSDTPPPMSVPNSRILKSPGKTSIAAPSADGTAPATDGDQPASKPVTTASRNEDFNKRRVEQADKDKKAAEEQRVAAEKSKNCERARSYQRSLESGTRIATADSKGERNYLNDDQRAKEIADTKRTVAGCN